MAACTPPPFPLLLDAINPVFHDNTYQFRITKHENEKQLGENEIKTKINK